MILVTGSLAFDHIMDFPGKFGDHILPDKIHMLNVSFLVPEMRKSFGGTAGNIAYSLALLGSDVSIFAVVGKDFSAYREFLQKNQVDTSLLLQDKELYTSTAFGITDKNDNQIWGFYPGADNLTHKLSIKNLIKKATSPERSRRINIAIVAPHNPKAMMKFAKEYTSLKIPYLFDPGMQLRWLGKKDLLVAFKGAKIIIGNDYEIQLMEKSTGIKDLHSLSAKDKIIITTLGKKGAKVSSDKKTFTVKAAKVKNASDPSGAGDAFRSGFIAGYVKGLDLKTCSQMGCVAAAYTVEKYGTTTHTYTKKEFGKRYKENYKEEILL